MADLLDLRQFRAAQLETLLEAEVEQWRTELDWDYGSSATLIRQYIDARILPGYVLLETSHLRAQPVGFGFFVYEGHKGLIGDVFVHPERRGPEAAGERMLLEAMLETLRATPGLERIEAQLMTQAPEVLGATFGARGCVAFRRLFLRRPLQSEEGGAEAAGGEGGALAGMRLEAWRGESSEDEAAQLILGAYEGHVDSRINDQYRNPAGALRFLHNIAHYPGCGVFDAGASLLARSRSSGRLEGMALISRVRPDVAHLTQLCVAPGRRGQGLGEALLGQTLRRLAQLGMRAVTLTVTRDNAGACRLYQRLGFTQMREFDALVWARDAA